MARREEQKDVAEDRRYAATLKYIPEKHSAPKVTAAGRGEIAKKILEVARMHDIPIHEDPDLAVALSKLDIGQEIPPALYRVVAEILAFIYRMNMLAAKQKSQRR